MNVQAGTRWTPDGRAPRRAAAEYLGIKPATLWFWASEGRGPMPRHIGGRVFYFKNDLDAFIATGAREAAQ
jgi:predicted DNA-binding transcriptional regulator AlpA